MQTPEVGTNVCYIDTGGYRHAALVVANSPDGVRKADPQLKPGRLHLIVFTARSASGRRVENTAPWAGAKGVAGWAPVGHTDITPEAVQVSAETWAQRNLPTFLALYRRYLAWKENR